MSACRQRGLCPSVLAQTFSSSCTWSCSSDTWQLACATCDASRTQSTGMSSQSVCGAAASMLLDSISATTVAQIFADVHPSTVGQSFGGKIKKLEGSQSGSSDTASSGGPARNGLRFHADEESGASFATIRSSLHGDSGQFVLHRWLHLS